ncbi:putative splicing factor U2AF 23 kDa subunit [[Candida] railenensis]|uniref:Splicing factor U2AF 23 kDa subunit n=1 Tax=[Candida] railenensis TaxID=45579 RepID=A0A9P0VW80_9ASCO|nr:putative splicing factor U2AF 23 kDa subunit [[Candida] railenensis]
MNDYRNDKSTCTFYTKIGACRHGEKCSRTHVKPLSSDTLLLPNLYQNPKLNKNEGEELSQKQIREYFDHFYKDIFLKFASIGEVDSLVVCENENNHLNGNVYVKFTNKDTAYNACLDLNQSWFGGRPVHSELSPVESFSDANCRAYETDSCNRGDHCNFMHIRKPSGQLRSSLYRSQEKRKILRELKDLGYEIGNDASETSKNTNPNPSINSNANNENSDSIDSKSSINQPTTSEPTTSVAAVAALFK